MDNENENENRGRPKKYKNEIERLNAIKESKKKYMAKKEWICAVCNSHNYTLSGKSKHLITKKHKDAVIRIVMTRMIDMTQYKLTTKITLKKYIIV